MEKTVKLIKLTLTEDKMAFEVRRGTITHEDEERILFTMENGTQTGARKIYLEEPSLSCRIGKELSAVVWTRQASPRLLQLELVNIIRKELGERQKRAAEEVALMDRMEARFKELF